MKDIGFRVDFFPTKKIEADDCKIESIEVHEDEKNIHNCFENRHTFSLNLMKPDGRLIFVSYFYHSIIYICISLLAQAFSVNPICPFP